MAFINEDLKNQTQAVLKRTGLDKIRTRKIIEALEICKPENVMNGCIGQSKSKHTRQRSAVATKSFTRVGDLQAVFYNAAPLCNHALKLSNFDFRLH